MAPRDPSTPDDALPRNASWAAVGRAPRTAARFARGRSSLPRVPHLVAALSLDVHAITLSQGYELLREAHDYLARRGREAAHRAALVEAPTAWGSAFKRVRVELPPDDRPTLVRADESHNLVEVVNQCATMERLLDALAWAQTPASSLGDYRVARCHPTTSSVAADAGTDHDLVLVGPAGEAAWFEVSDVAGAVDGNRKEEKDLRSLGLLREGRGAARCDVVWPAARVFLVVSVEFYARLRTRRWPHLVYQGTAVGRGTVIAEVRPRGPDTPTP